MCVILLSALSKAHLLDPRASAGTSVYSAIQNIAATFVNAFVNAGFGRVICFAIYTKDNV
jgi:hypothetical protein